MSEWVNCMLRFSVSEWIYSLYDADLQYAASCAPIPTWFIKAWQDVQSLFPTLHWLPMQTAISFSTYD